MKQTAAGGLSPTHQRNVSSFLYPHNLDGLSSPLGHSLSFDGLGLGLHFRLRYRVVSQKQRLQNTPRSSVRRRNRFVFKRIYGVFFTPACLYLKAVCAARVLHYSDRTARGS